MGLITWLIVTPLSRLIKRDPHEIGALPDGVKSQPKDISNVDENLQKISFSISKILKTRSFWLLALIWVFWSSSSSLLITHLVPHVTDIGFSAGEAAIVLSIVGVTGIVGSILMGRISDNIGRHVAAIVCSLLQAIGIGLLIWARELWVFYLFAAIYGFASSGFSPVVTALIGDTLGLRNLGMIIGILSIASSIGMVIGPAMGGIIFDIQNSYSLAFSIGVGTMVIITIIIALVKRAKSGISQTLEEAE
jgi:MFS family permease